MKMYALIGKLVTRSGNRDKLVSILSEAAKEVGGIAGCEAYRVHVSLDEPDTVFVYEVWKSEETHQASLTIPEVKAYIDQARPILENVERIATLELRS
ncbi:putative quinol monooxygenase [Exiguobacterium algae]|uniref:putative quinol monooxygenase n=1 Tax=Exiguobacterium algae TaxID=2751250 RepID=UPI001F0A756E|nr:putative quinol monooxygenase [Exiguobacterium algae]